MTATTRKREEARSPARMAKAPRDATPAWVVFAALLLVEYLAISFLVDAQDLLRPAGLEDLLGNIGGIAPLAFIFVAAVFLTGGVTVRLRLRTLSAYRNQRNTMLLMGLVHVLAFAGTVLLALHLSSLSAQPAASARPKLALWFLLVLGSLGSLVFALWSPRMLLSAVRGLRRELTAGLFVGVVAWGAGLLARQLWHPMAWLTLESVHMLLVAVASDPVASIELALVGTSRFYVEVAPVCSGVEGVGLMLTFVGAFLYGHRHELEWPRSFLLLPLSALLAWVLNVVRVTALVAVGTWYSPEVALGGFHSKAGWVFFTLAALGTVLFVQGSKTFAIATAQSPSAADTADTGAPDRAAPDASLADTAAPDTAAADRAAPDTSALDTGAGAEREAGVMLNTAESEIAAGELTAGELAAGETTGRDNFALTTAYLAPMLAVLATKLLTGLITSGFDVFYPLTVVAALVVLVRYRRHYPPIQFASAWLPLGVGCAVAAIWILGFQHPDSPSQYAEGIAALSAPAAALWLAARILGTVVTVPIVEELAFRGYMMRRFVSADFDAVPFRHFSWLGLIVSSVAFGLLHSQWELGILAGVVFGFLTVARGRLSDAIVAHSAANAAIVVYVLVTRDWALLG